MADIKLALKVDAENPIIGDLYLEGGTPRLTKTLAEEVAQELFIRFRFFQGEWFLDGTVGLPYNQKILGVKTPIGILDQIFKSVVTTCPGVQNLITFSLTRLPGRGLSPVFACKLIDGAILKSADFGPFIIGGT